MRIFSSSSIVYLFSLLSILNLLQFTDIFRIPKFLLQTFQICHLLPVGEHQNFALSDQFSRTCQHME